MLSQASREGWKDAQRNEGQYKLTALAEANELERASSIITSVYTNESLKSMNTVKVSLLKSRNGRLTSEPIETFIEPDYYTFGNTKGSSDVSSTKFSDINLNDLFNTNQDELSTLSSFNEDILDLSNIDLGI